MSNFSTIVPNSPDPNIVVDTDLTAAKLGDVNYIIRAIKTAPVYVDNAAALLAGLLPGDIYLTTATNSLSIVV